MVEINIEYQGDLRCKAVHGPSQTTLYTDAPLDNQGKGESFSPTDLAATSLGTCMATIMGIFAKRHQIHLEGMKIRVEKHMQQNPRKISKLVVEFEIPVRPEENLRLGLERAALECPVHQSLDPAIEKPVIFKYPSN